MQAGYLVIVTIQPLAIYLFLERFKVDLMLEELLEAVATFYQ